MQDDFDSGMGLPDDDLGGASGSEMGEGGAAMSDADHEAAEAGGDSPKGRRSSGGEEIVENGP